MSIQSIAAEAAAKAKTVSKPAEKLPAANGKPANGKPHVPEIYYDAPKRKFWAHNDRQELVEYPATHIRLMLIEAGVSPQQAPGEVMNPVEANFLRIRQKNDVNWSGALAGYKPGVYDICGTRILITSGPKIIRAARGPWPTIKDLLGQLLGDQVEHVYGWLKSALRALHHGPPWRPGQALAIAGPAGCGKSLLQSMFTEILGGRVAKPYRYLSGETPFNGDLIAAEHLAIEDDAESTDLRTRRHFGSQLKGLIANSVTSFHPKGGQAMSLTPFWRVSITLNDEPENLMVLPPLDSGLKDKIFLLRAWMTTLPFANDNLTERTRYRQKLTEELPAFIHFLQTWRIPTKWKDQRYGVKAWQNAELLYELQTLQPEFRLLELIERLHVWHIDAQVWEGTAIELERELRDKDKRGEVDRLITFNSAVGTYLGRLVKCFPERIMRKRGENNTTIWQIKR
jgi:hypothetical protein